MRQVLYGVIVLAMSLASAPANADNAAATTQPSTVIEWAPLTGIDHQVFPSEIVSMATSNLRLAFLRVKMFNVLAGSKIHVTVKCESFIDDSSEDFVAPKDTATLFLPIKTNWKFDRLARIRQQIPVNFTYSLTIDGEESGEKTDTAIVHSINDCILEYRDDAGKAHPFRFLFAAYVNEGHPQIDKLLKDALATHIVNQFDAYQKKDPKMVYRQVFAIWNMLQSKGIKYSDITAVPDKSDIVRSQHVRFLDESIDNAQANCVDGSILFASVLTKIGIECNLVVKPGHMFIVFFTSPGLKEPVALETTMLGNTDLARDRGGGLLDFLDPMWQSKASAKSFRSAIQFGSEEYNAVVAAVKKQTADHSDEFVGKLISISGARKDGILPIPAELTANPN